MGGGKKKDGSQGTLRSKNEEIIDGSIAARAFVINSIQFAPRRGSCR